MKYLESKNKLFVIEFQPKETMFARSACGEALDLKEVGLLTGANPEEIREFSDYFTDFIKQDVSRNHPSKVSLTGRQLNVLKNIIAEVLKEVASFEFSLRNPATEEEAVEMLIAIKRIQDEVGNYGK